MIPGEETVDIRSEQHPQALVISLVGSFDALTADTARKALGLRYRTRAGRRPARLLHGLQNHQRQPLSDALRLARPDGACACRAE